MLQAIVEKGSVKEAAVSLHKTQPALTMAIRKLEEQLGFELLDRQQYRLSLTERGRMFYQEAELVLYDLSQLREFANELSRGNEASFSISYEQMCFNSAINNVLIRTFGNFKATRFNISGGSRFHSLQSLIDGSADLGIGPWFHLFHGEGNFESIPIGKMEIILVASPKLLDASTISHSRQLSRFPSINIQQTELHFDSEKLTFIRGLQQIKVADFFTMKSLLLDGAGLAIISKEQCQEEIERGLLQQITLEDIEPSLEAELRVFRNSARRHGPVAEYIWAKFVKLAKSKGYQV